tara:strand:- start:667 stop:2238 length:1572 start_codon:yes stop_codon:yes gene_type:complete
MKLLIESFRNFISEVQKLVCPPATQDLELNTKNRDAAIQAEHIQYGPLNVDVPGSYWQDIAKYWNTTEDAAKASLCGNCVAFDISPRMKECMPGETSDKDGQLGYCWMHHFKCHSARACRTWAKGGPIIEDDKSAEWQEKNETSVEEEVEQYNVSNIKNLKKDAKELGVTLENKEEDLELKIHKALANEGGASGMDALIKRTGATEEEIKATISSMEEVGQHPDGDYILQGGDIIVDEDKICAAGVAWAKRTYDKWPSAYASMGASKYCKKKNESIQENELDECWSTHERVPGTKEGAPGSCRKKTSEDLKKEGALKKWRDENWVQSDGTPCGDDKAQKNPKRCKPKSKWSTMSKSEKSADNAKKKAGGKKGKQFVSATKKGKVTKSHTKESLDMKISKLQLEQIIKEELSAVINEEEYYEVDAKNINEEYCPVCQEAQLEEKKKKACKPSKGKRFAKRVDGKCRSFGQAGQAKSGGDRIRPGTKKGDAYCARSAGIKKCKNPPCANTLSRKKWKCRGKKSVA